MQTEQQSSGATVRVWDPMVRIGHWVLVVAFATAYLTEGEPLWVHTWAGYAIATTVVVRLLWGFAGSKHARFSDFVKGPRQVADYLRAMAGGTAKRFIGHSPAGGAMTIVLLAMLVVTTFTGMATLAAEEGQGPLSGFIARGADEGSPAMSGSNEPGEENDDDDRGAERESVWTEIHEVSANLTLVLILLHLGGVALASYAHRENLPRSMVTGRKRI